MSIPTIEDAEITAESLVRVVKKEVLILILGLIYGFFLINIVNWMFNLLN